jgi:hypothetical protein
MRYTNLNASTNPEQIALARDAQGDALAFMKATLRRKNREYQSRADRATVRVKKDVRRLFEQMQDAEYLDRRERLVDSLAKTQLCEQLLVNNNADLAILETTVATAMNARGIAYNARIDREHIVNAWLVIRDYVETGGENVSKGTGLPDPRRGKKAS